MRTNNLEIGGAMKSVNHVGTYGSGSIIVAMIGVKMG